MACNHNQDPGQDKLVYLHGGLRSGAALYTVQQREAWGGGANQLGKRQPSAAASCPCLCAAKPTKYEACEAWCGAVGDVVWSGMVWCGVVWCAAIVLLRRIGPGPECMNLVQAAMMLWQLRCACPAAFACRSPAPIRSFVRIRTVVRPLRVGSRKVSNW